MPHCAMPGCGALGAAGACCAGALELPPVGPWGVKESIWRLLDPINVIYTPELPLKAIRRGPYAPGVLNQLISYVLGCPDLETTVPNF